MVRLKAKKGMDESQITGSFNSTMVRLKEFKELRGRDIEHMFQFHNGPIKRSYRLFAV